MPGVIKNESYLVIQSWMVTKLHLKGNSLLTYALVYGFSQDAQSSFYGTLNYVASWLGSTKEGARQTLDKLVSDTLLVKEVEYRNNVRFVSYKVNPLFVGGYQTKLDTPTNNVGYSTQQSLPNNNINNNKDNKEVVEEGVNDLGAFAHLNRNNQQQITSNSINNEFAEKDIQDHLAGEGSVKTARSATKTPQGVGREGGASQPDGAKPRKKFYYLKDLDKQTLENLKQDILENRFQEEGSLTYRDIQKKYSLIDNLEFDTPLYIDSLLTLREQGEKQEKTGIRYY